MADTLAWVFDHFGELLRRGDFDRMLVRPQSTVLQLAGHALDLRKLGRMFQALVVFAYGVAHVQAAWWWLSAPLLAAAVVAGAAVFFALWWLQGTMCFWSTESLELMNIVTMGGTRPRATRCRSIRARCAASSASWCRSLAPRIPLWSLRSAVQRELRGEQPASEIDVPPPAAALLGQWSLPAKWIAAIAGLGVGAALVANAGLSPAPLTAAGEAVAPRAVTGADPAPHLEVVEPEVALPTQAKSSVPARAGNRELPKRTALQPAAAARAQSPVRPQEPPAAQVVDSAEQQPSGAARALPADAPANAVPQKTAPAAAKILQRKGKELASETLTKEAQLLRAAQLALRAGDTQRSLALLAEHTWSYPRGHLAEARDVARILALCQAGSVTESQLHAKRFLQQRPESPYALRVRAGCAALSDREP